MITWVDIEDTQGNKLGDGPLTTILSSSFSEALSEAAKFSFTVLAADPRAPLIAYERIAVRHLVENGVTIRQAGIIKSITLTLTADGLPAYDVSGFNLLYELSYELINIELFDYKFIYPHVLEDDEGNLYTKWSIFDGNPQTYEEVKIRANDSSLLICCEVPFDQVHFSLKDENQAQTAFGWFWRGENWVQLGTEDNFIDTMVDHLPGEINPRPLRSSGMISFNAPRSWRHRNFNDHVDLQGKEVYAIMFDPMYGNTVVTTIRDIQVRGKGPTPRDLTLVLAGSNWKLVGHQNTGELTRMFLWDLSRLAALTKLADYRGHGFRLAEERSIEWLRQEDLGEDCGITIIAAPPGEVVSFGGMDICYVKSAKRLIESYDITTAVRAKGGGLSSERTSPHNSTWSMPDGYIYDPEADLIISEAAEADLGRRIEKLVSFGLVGSGIDLIGNRDTTDNANELLRAAVAWLQKHDKPHRAFDIEVVGLRKRLKVGQKIRIQYYSPAQGVNLNDSLYILGIETKVSKIVTHRLVVSSVAQWGRKNSDFIADTQHMLQELLGHEQGVPKLETVASSQVTTTRDFLTEEELAALQIKNNEILNKINEVKK